MVLRIGQRGAAARTMGMKSLWQANLKLHALIFTVKTEASVMKDSNCCLLIGILIVRSLAFVKAPSLLPSRTGSPVAAPSFTPFARTGLRCFGPPSRLPFLCEHVFDRMIFTSFTATAPWSFWNSSKKILFSSSAVSHAASNLSMSSTRPFGFAVKSACLRLSLNSEPYPARARRGGGGGTIDHRRGVVWCGVAWCGVAWCGVV